jgi:hypothetical protein
VRFIEDNRKTSQADSFPFDALARAAEVLLSN